MIASAQALWWLALPLLLLPVWWHRQKRQRIKSEPLATARFLPSAPPQQQRVWRWDDPVLLLVRCLLLIALIAWLAAVTLPWRGDTVLVDPALEQDAGRAWAAQQIAAVGLSGAQRMPLPSDALQWLQAHEHEWRPGARLLIVAASLPLPARLPQFAHAVDIRIRPAPRAAAIAPAEHHIALATTPARAPAWRALFAAFGAAGGGTHRYVLGDAPAAKTELIVWDKPEPMPSAWRAPLWWLAPKAVAPGLAAAKPITVYGIALQVADTAQGRVWASDAWPPQDAGTAAVLYETWQALSRPAPPYAAPSLLLASQRSAPLALPGIPPAEWLAYLLLALFALERILTHARRR